MTMSLVDPQGDPPTGMVGGQAPAAEQRKILRFTILHTNDMHSNLIGVGPASEYSPGNPQRRWHDRRH
jgi:2',3'-cyclic-nucleotide 2'-phosphodiesterase (5'-nucleotidase family)